MGACHAIRSPLRGGIISYRRKAVSEHWGPRGRADAGRLARPVRGVRAGFAACPDVHGGPAWFAEPVVTRRSDPTLLEGCVDGKYRRASTRRTLAGRLNGEGISTSKSGFRCVHEGRHIDLSKRAVCRALGNARTQYFAGGTDRKHATPAGGDLDIAYRVEAPARRLRSRHHALWCILGRCGDRCNHECQCSDKQCRTRSYHVCHLGAPFDGRVVGSIALSFGCGRR
jgi:hypothetical protein